MPSNRPCHAIDQARHMSIFIVMPSYRQAIEQAGHINICNANFTVKFLSMPSYRQAIKQAGHMNICMLLL
jgi:hypothetical protein